MKKIHISKVLFGSQKIQKTFLKIKFLNEFKGKTNYMCKKILTSFKNSKIFWFFYPGNKKSIFYIFLKTFFLFLNKNTQFIFDFDFLNNEKICAYKCWTKIGINLVTIGKKYKKILDKSINQSGFFFNPISIKNLFLVYLFSKFSKALINIKFEKFFKKNLFIFYDSNSSKNIFEEQFSKKNKKPHLNEYENIFERILGYKNFNFSYSEYDVGKSGSHESTYEKEVNFCKYFRILSKKAPNDFCFFDNYQAKKNLHFIFKASLFLKFLKNKKLILKKKKNLNFHFFPIIQFNDGMFLFSKFEWLNEANNSFGTKIFYSSKFSSKLVNENYSANFGKKYKHERNVDTYDSRKKKKKNIIFKGYLFLRPPKKHFSIFLDKLKGWKDFKNDNITRLFAFFEKKKIFEDFFILDKKFSEKGEFGSQEFLKPKTLVNLSRSSINNLILNFLFRTKDFENLRIFLILNIFKLNPVLRPFSYIPKKKMIDCKISKKNKNFFKIFNFSFLINKIFFKNSYN